jgi:hypothetical protein
MRVALYGEQGNEPWLEAFAEGWGKVVWRHPHFWQGEVEGFDLVVLASLWAKNGDILNAYRARGIPVLVIDLGFIRNKGHRQASLNGLNHVPGFPCPPDRWDALGCDVRPSGGDPDGCVLVAAQRPCDASHGLTEAAYNAWLATQDGKIRWHPIERENEQTLAEDLAGARMLKTLCSTAGLEALMAGIPAVADQPERAVWGELSGITLPGMAERLNLFHRIAYGQWTMEEMRDGTCAAFLRNHLLPNMPMDMPKAGTNTPKSGNETPKVGNEPKRRGRPRKVKA